MKLSKFRRFLHVLNSSVKAIYGMQFYSVYKSIYTAVLNRDSLTLAMDICDNSISFMLSIYNIKFASKLREDVLNLSTKHCYGCEVEHPSQTQHTCLMWTESEHLEMHFEEALVNVNRKAVINMWQDEMKKMEWSGWANRNTVDISERARETFVELLEDVDWCKKNLPKPDRLYNDVQNFSQLFQRFFA